MSLTVLYFAWVKDKVGCGAETLTPPGDVATVSQLMDWLATQSPGHAAASSIASIPSGCAMS